MRHRGSDDAALPPKVRQSWQDAGAGSRYADSRWRNARRSARDRVLVGRILSRHGIEAARILDAPCGTGRLRPALEARARAYVGVDVSAPMLEVAARGGADGLIRGDLECLPFRDGAFDVVVCCRILHHLASEEALATALGELVRVSGRLVIASFWDRSSVSGLRRRLRRRGGGRTSRRSPHHKDVIAAAFAGAGARVVDWDHSLRYLSMQAFAVAEKSA